MTPTTIWDILTALGTVGAVAVSLGLALREAARTKRAEQALQSERLDRRLSERRSIASLVSGWTESTYASSTDGTHYIRSVHAKISNESSEPVYNVRATFATAESNVQLGPLSLPFVIPVLAARQQRRWDLTAGILAHAEGTGMVPMEPVVRLEFSDSEGVTWLRDYDGELVKNPPAPPALEAEEGSQQAGPLNSALNPLGVAIDFMNMLADADSIRDLKPILAPSASRWDELGQNEFIDFRNGLASYGIAMHVWYPAPRVAYVRLVHDDDAEQIRTTGRGRIQWITLILLPSAGWRIFSAGGEVTQPDWVEFPRKSLLKELRD